MERGITSELAFFFNFIMLQNFKTLFANRQLKFFYTFLSEWFTLITVKINCIIFVLLFCVVLFWPERICVNVLNAQASLDVNWAIPYISINF